MQELVIKVPAPFSGIEDLGFTARYPAQEWTEKLRDVPFIIEGPAAPMRRLVDRIMVFSEKDHLVADADDEAYSWSSPMQLSDELCVLAFKDRSLMQRDEDPLAQRGYIWNLVRPLAFTFLRDCVRLAQLRLAEQIEVILDAGQPPLVGLELQRAAITPANGSFLLSGL